MADCRLAGRRNDVDPPSKSTPRPMQKSRSRLGIPLLPREACLARPSKPKSWRAHRRPRVAPARWRQAAGGIAHGRPCMLPSDPQAHARCPARSLPQAQRNVVGQHLGRGCLNRSVDNGLRGLVCDGESAHLRRVQRPLLTLLGVACFPRLLGPHHPCAVRAFLLSTEICCVPLANCSPRL
jgi:hypothetical protein